MCDWAQPSYRQYYDPFLTLPWPGRIIENYYFPKLERYPPPRFPVCLVQVFDWLWVRVIELVCWVRVATWIFSPCPGGPWTLWSLQRFNYLAVDAWRCKRIPSTTSLQSSNFAESTLEMACIWSLSLPIKYLSIHIWCHLSPESLPQLLHNLGWSIPVTDPC